MHRLVVLLPLLAACPRAMHYPDGRGIEGQLEREVVALQQTVRVLEHQASSCSDQGPPAKIYSELNQVLHGTEVGLAREGSITILTLPSGHVFGRDGLSIREEARMTLDMISTALKLHPDYRVQVEGHTDDGYVPGHLREFFSDNWAYSIGRAREVMLVMEQAYGVDESRFQLIGRGEYDPIASNDTESGRTQNRRVVLRILPPEVSP